MRRKANRLLAMAGAAALLVLQHPATAARGDDAIRTAGAVADCSGDHRREVGDCLRAVAADVRGCLGTCRTSAAARECAMDCAGMLDEGRSDCRQGARLRRAACH